MPILLMFLRITEHTGQLLVGPNALWPTQPKFWVGHGPTLPPCNGVHSVSLDWSVEQPVVNAKTRVAWTAWVSGLHPLVYDTESEIIERGDGYNYKTKESTLYWVSACNFHHISVKRVERNEPKKTTIRFVITMTCPSVTYMLYYVYISTEESMWNSTQPVYLSK